ncbi:MAG: metal ABC transporter ATP-binding protein [Rhodobacteraceae bacterium]|nr:MAG: metal ABC transporter ATP-binding protein [Paracoccaceae bacterium]
MSLIKIDNVTLHLGGRLVLDDVSMTVEPGEIVTIVGPNGSGKSTLMKVVIGALQPDSGAVIRKPGLRIGYVPQKLHIDPTLPLTVRRFLSLPKRVSNEAAHAALDDAGAGHLCMRQMTDLSGGQFQRVLLARALLSEPDLLILDEATQGLDQTGSADFYSQIERLRQNKGVAVLMVSHELHVVMSTSDRVICLNGHVCCHGAPEHVASAPEYRALFGTGTHGALALYRHDHSLDHCDHDHAQDHAHAHTHDHGQNHSRNQTQDKVTSA